MQPRQTAVEAALGWWNDALIHGRQDKLLKALTAPNVQAKLSQLKQLAPRSKRFIEGFSVFTTLVSEKIGEERLPAQEPVAVE
jgi:hypothetical protein